KSIIQILDLKRPIYRATASYGHFGRAAENGYFTWEKTDQAGELRRAAAKA
ncbi:MAG: methionine adenosyltransferase domain-containing protein, partial [Deltaproteobacteria bacterium]|nr:methionine adenosyltransferase domain-containing protein [Deltaproteobacteria bacterium]